MAIELGTYHNAHHGWYHTQAVGVVVAVRGTSWAGSDPSSQAAKLASRLIPPAAQWVHGKTRRELNALTKPAVETDSRVYSGFHDRLMEMPCSTQLAEADSPGDENLRRRAAEANSECPKNLVSLSDVSCLRDSREEALLLLLMSLTNDC